MPFQYLGTRRDGTGRISYSRPLLMKKTLSPTHRQSRISLERRRRASQEGGKANQQRRAPSCERRRPGTRNVEDGARWRFSTSNTLLALLAGRGGHSVDDGVVAFAAVLWGGSRVRRQSFLDKLELVDEEREREPCRTLESSLAVFDVYCSEWYDGLVNSVQIDKHICLLSRLDLRAPCSGSELPKTSSRSPGLSTPKVSSHPVSYFVPS
ncbi:hypothetical protein GGR56DRAFT_140269 [Xylariaceae sp. FL0804]|nr:hypothetical protein GGR56DRAFT_140269 [Xylariaceae sp. FL0804]